MLSTAVAIPISGRPPIPPLPLLRLYMYVENNLFLPASAEGLAEQCQRGLVTCQTRTATSTYGSGSASALASASASTTAMAAS